jgi:hypothetical protein
MLVFVRPNSSYVRPKLKVIGQMSCQVKYLFAALVTLAGLAKKYPKNEDLRSDSGKELVKDELVDVIVPNDWLTIPLAWYSVTRKYTI